MKKIILIGVIICGILKAEPIGFEVGFKTMQTNFQTSLQYHNNYGPDDFIDEDTLGLNSPNMLSYWFLFDHPIPIAPNYKATLTYITSVGAPIANFTWATKPFVFDKTAEINLGYLDNIFYYRIIEDSAKFNAGLGFRSYNGYVRIDDNSKNNYELLIENVFPIIYVDTGITIPYTPVTAQAEIIAITASDHKIIDYNLALQYVYKPLGIGGVLGYRHYSFTLTKVHDISSEFIMSGIYYGVLWQF